MLELFILPNCPYCLKVLKFLDENNIKYATHSILEPDNKEKLMKLGGKVQVPFLIDKTKNIQMYESDDIIDHIKSSL